MSSLAELRDRVEQLLVDVSHLIWTSDLLDEALRQALDAYSAVNPLTAETVISLPGAGREIALDGVDGLRQVLEVRWPYDSSLSESWPPNRVRGFRLIWDDARPVLFLDILDGAQPQAEGELRLWYAMRHTLQDLDSADLTSLPMEHESLLVMGAAGHAALSRAVDLIETAGTDLYQVGLLATWGQHKLRQFDQALEALRQVSTRQGPAWGQGWRLDGWDEAHGSG